MLLPGGQTPASKALVALRSQCLVLDLLHNVAIQAPGDFFPSAGRPGEHSFASLRAEFTLRHRLPELGKRLVRPAKSRKDMLMDS